MITLVPVLALAAALQVAVDYDGGRHKDDFHRNQRRLIFEPFSCCPPTIDYSSDEDSRSQDVHKSYVRKGGFRTFDVPGKGSKHR